MKIYIASPLFSKAEGNWIDLIQQKLLAAGFEVYSPYVECSKLPFLIKSEIFKTCLTGLHSSDIVLAVLDGSQVDDGTSWEIGYAFANSTPIYGLRTDFRICKDGTDGTLNCMIEVACSAIMDDIDQLIEKIKTERVVL